LTPKQSATFRTEEARLSDAPKPQPSDRTPDYDALLYRRKGMSGSEFAGVGLQFAITIVVFAFAGVWLDRRLGASPWFTVVMVFAGATLGFWSMYRRVSRPQHKRAGGDGA
jgi:hypothetical protein